MTAFAAAIIAVAAAPPLRAQASRLDGDGPREVEYAASIARVADSAIHRLDFFPTRLQLRAQMLFLGGRDSAAVVFAALSARSSAAALDVDDVSSAFERTNVPSDLRRLHAELVDALHAARGALDRLARAADACAVEPASVMRCQTPFTAASSALGRSYARYLDTRQKIAEQITDTKTRLPAFNAMPARRNSPGVPAPAPSERSTPGTSHTTPVVFRQESPYLLSTSYRRDDGAGFIRRP